jgi:hypothetical protein
MVKLANVPGYGGPRHQRFVERKILLRSSPAVAARYVIQAAVNRCVELEAEFTAPTIFLAITFTTKLDFTRVHEEIEGALNQECVEAWGQRNRSISGPTRRKFELPSEVAP